MAKRSITDEEIGLIKAMLGRSMKNRDIQFYFNRQDRPVNSGRITQIRDGSYGPNAVQATEAALNVFLSSFKPSTIGAMVQNGASTIEPTKADRAKALFEKNTGGAWRLKDGETDESECKQEFDPKKLSPVLCALAAMSNNRGGFLFLGVANADCEAVGVGDAFDSFDIAKLMDKVKVHLAPTPRITCKGVIDLNGTKVGFIHVDPHPDKPVIVSKDDGDKLREGEILFRYAGQSARIKFTDLREMLAERDRRAQLALAHAAGKLADVGTSNALILDTDKNVLDADGRKIFIDEELAKSINFIKEGQFNEIDGAPTLKLVGEVTPVNAQALTTEKLVPKAIAQNDILLAFLEQEAVTNPKEYVLAGVSQPRTWLPIFYFANLASVQPAEMADEVKNVGTSQKAKRQSVLDRFAGTKTAYAKPPTKKAAAAIAAIIDGTFVVPKTIGEASIFSQAMTSIAKTTASLDKILSALKASYALAVSADDGAVLSFVFKAACRADEIFFQPQ